MSERREKVVEEITEEEYKILLKSNPKSVFVNDQPPTNKFYRISHTDEESSYSTGGLQSDPKGAAKALLIIVSAILCCVGLFFMFGEPSELYGGDAYNGIVSNIRGATFIIFSGFLFISSFFIKKTNE
jgi:hypothetical protein